ncbi:uncharacterized protein FOMMEDRAFT_150609 [Fomitiporia mediterranea MF3/22]|uniref:uncharacterized protein n=1 Tax=Fomitiporia mediterranea (strain MF3/22) TaxID=694068 RepID=UPI0004409B5F|nr:uncharacterized protein FOMMEDRAFT_150609 [Fomitiporia mediterranea MF3/22]EJD07986.1 hypothetical protein FOMMEDRAFT_150609 [Fomitiporia mediterranea MF3/22]
MATKVLVLGATRYLGGCSVLASLVKSYPNVKFSAVVRTSTTSVPDSFAAFAKQSNAITRPSSIPDKFRAIGVEPILGSLDDLDLVTKLSTDADIIIDTADSENADLLNALLEGQKHQKAEGKPTASFVHTSGTLTFTDKSGDGKFNTNGKLWTDSEEDIPCHMVKLLYRSLMKASEAGIVTSFIISPSGVYGTCTGPVERDSLISRLVVSNFLNEKRAYYVGEGSNRDEFIHLEDLVSLFEKVFKLALDALSTPPTTSPYKRYYIASTTPIPWKDVVERFACQLHKKGLIKSSKPIVISSASEDLGPLAHLLASNMNTRGFRREELGWKPKHIAF